MRSGGCPVRVPELVATASVRAAARSWGEVSVRAAGLDITWEVVRAPRGLCRRATAPLRSPSSRGWGNLLGRHGAAPWPMRVGVSLASHLRPEVTSDACAPGGRRDPAALCASGLLAMIAGLLCFAITCRLRCKPGPVLLDCNTWTYYRVTLSGALGSGHSVLGFMGRRMEQLLSDFCKRLDYGLISD